MKKLLRKSKKIVLKILLALFIFTIVWVIMYRFINPPFTSLMLMQYLANNSPGKTINKKWQNIDQISKNIALAVISSEDQRYLDHYGFDFREINNAILEFEKRGKFRGASTISQQTAKNVFLWPHRSFIRKGFEMYFTVLIELLWGKNRIVEVYLNVAEFGDTIYGVESAANYYFNKSSKNLTYKESAYLAALLPNPRILTEKGNSDYLRERQYWIIRQMNNLGGVSYVEKLYKK